MAKSAEAFRTISEVAEWLDLPTHVLRFWESKFSQVKPVKRAGGRRYYRPNDMLLLGGVKKLLHDDGMTIKGAQKVLREQGAKYVSGLSQELEGVDLEPLEEAAIETSVETRLAAAPEAETLHTPPTEQDEPQTTAASDIPEAEVEDNSVVSFRSKQIEDVPSKSDEASELVSEPAYTQPAAETIDPPIEELAENPNVERSTEAEPESLAPAKQAAGLPSFMQSEPTPSTASKAPEPASLDITTVDDPSDMSIDANAGVLSRLAASKARLPADVLSGLAQAQSALKEHAANA